MTKTLTDALWPILAHGVTYSSLTSDTPVAQAASDYDGADATTLALADEKSSYVRPNGLTYLPRHLMVGENKMQDVTFIRSCIASKLPVLLYGPPGTGKTALVEAAFGDCYTVQGTIETEVADFVGSWIQQPDGTYQWVDGPLPRSMEQGKKLLIDEIALIDPRVMAVVYGVMDGRDELVVTQNPARGAVHVKPGFAVLGACNPDVPGAIMSDALLSRFIIHAEMKTDWGIASKLGVTPKIIQVTRNLNEKQRNGEVTAAPQMRELIAYRDVAAQFGEELALSNYVSQVRPENREVVAAAVEAVFGQRPKVLTF